MFDWQKKTTADRDAITARAKSIGIGAAVSAYFARVKDQWDGRDAVTEGVGKDQFMRDAANILDEQLADLEAILRERKLSTVPNADAVTFETPLEQGLYFVEIVD